jgi:DNA invertase Pin-like site-specific DNA recombinase
MESGVDFVACDNPHATKLTIQILSALAEHEREQISQRTIAALAVLKARGVKLGNPNLEAARRRAAEVRRTVKSAPELVSIVVGLARQGLSRNEIARRLNRLGLRAVRGRPFFQATVRQLLLAAATVPV